VLQVGKALCEVCQLRGRLGLEVFDLRFQSLQLKVMTAFELVLQLHISQDCDPLHHDFGILALDLSHRLQCPDLIPHSCCALCDLDLALM
jgi:hypothetical protein